MPGPSSPGMKNNEKIYIAKYYVVDGSTCFRY